LGGRDRRISQPVIVLRWRVAIKKWRAGFDQDGPMASATRLRLLDMAATDGIAVLGYHFPFPGVGHVMRMGDAYRFVPALWTWG